jgi:hypothetical protein
VRVACAVEPGGVIVFRLRWRKPSPLLVCSTVVWLGVMVWLAAAQHRLGSCLAHGIPVERARAIAQRYAEEPLAGARVNQTTEGDERTYWFTVPALEGGTICYEVSATMASFEGYERLDIPDVVAPNTITEEQARETIMREGQRIAGRAVRGLTWDCSRSSHETWSVLGRREGHTGLAGLDCVYGDVRADGRVARFSVVGMSGIASSLGCAVLAVMIAIPLHVGVVFLEYRRDRARRKAEAQASAPAGSQF